MYRLYSAPNTYAMGVHAVLEELGVPYELVQATLFSDAPDPYFLRVSPHGRVPALVDETGPVFESVHFHPLAYAAIGDDMNKLARQIG